MYILFGPLWPNMHLAGHLTDCIRDHGPVYAFWLYAFERMNGILGSFQTNSIDFTVQLMRKFSRLQQFSLEQWPVEIRQEFAMVFKDCKTGSGSVLETTYSSKSIISKPIPPLIEKSLEDCEIAKIIATVTELTFSNSQSRDCPLYHKTANIYTKNIGARQCNQTR